jgi:hypothetical protein
MDYTTLVDAKTVDGSIKNWVNWSQTPSEVILAEAEAWIYRTLRVRKMHTLQAGDITMGAATLDLPTGYKATTSFRRSGLNPGPIKIVPVELFEQILVTDENADPQLGCPTVACMDGTVFRFNCTADTDYTYRLWYFGALPALSGSNLTNFLTDDLPDVLRNACLYRAFDHLKQWAAATRNENLAKEGINLANAEWDMERQEFSFENYWEGDL